MREKTSTRLETALKLKKMNQTELATLSGISKSLISSYVNGRYVPTLESIETFAKILKVSPVWLAGFDVSMDEEIPSYEDGVLTIPFINQKLSAGTGWDYLSSDDIEIKKIDILEKMARGIDKTTLIAAEVIGDSMIDAGIDSGDIVIFSKGMVRQEGIYVINYVGDVMVKKLSFNAIDGAIDIISCNKNYPTRTVDASNVSILGKVVGWIHKLDF